MRRLLMTAVVLALGCTPDYPKCKNDSHCKEHEYCVNGMCQQCRDKSDCKAGEVCNKGRCEKQVTACTDDSQCGPSESCIDGKCQACASDDQCGAGGKCNHGRCQRAPANITTTEPGEENPVGPCKLEPVYFDFNESVLSTEATASIDRNAECIKKAVGKSVTLIGRSDPRGTEEYNLALSDHRAGSVKDRLVRVGVEGGRLRTVAKGELDATGTDEAGWVKDRRVDFSW
jgi:peptidoglycan-associated lipoprotein